MVKLQIIYTMDNGQHLANFPLFDYVLETKRNFATFVKQAYYQHICFLDNDRWGMGKDGKTLGLPEDMPTMPVFVKISCCILISKGSRFKEPAWYKKCNGKLYWSDLNPGKKNPYA